MITDKHCGVSYIGILSILYVDNTKYYCYNLYKSQISKSFKKLGSLKEMSQKKACQMSKQVKPPPPPIQYN